VSKQKILTRYHAGFFITKFCNTRLTGIKNMNNVNTLTHHWWWRLA